MILLPYRVCVVLERWPFANFALIGVNIAVYALTLTGVLSRETLGGLALHGWVPSGLLGHMFLHAGFWHLFGNMVALWVFGNGVCARIGNLPYLALYFLGGLAAATLHNLLSGGPMIGASGAINAVLGFFVVLYPLNRIETFYCVYVRYGTFEVATGWMVAFWFAIDLLNTLTSINAGSASAAHIGGFLLGFSAAYWLVKNNHVDVEHYDNPTLVDLRSGRAREKNRIYPRRRNGPAGPGAIQLDEPPGGTRDAD